jgi:hypothetical protein
VSRLEPGFELAIACLPAEFLNRCHAGSRDRFNNFHLPFQYLGRVYIEDPNGEVSLCDFPSSCFSIRFGIFIPLCTLLLTGALSIDKGKACWTSLRAV